MSIEPVRGGRGVWLLAALVPLLSACMQDPGDDYARIEGPSATTEIAGRSYRVVIIENEPFGHVIGPPMAIDVNGRHIAVEPPTLSDPPFEAAVRIEGTAEGDFDGALRAFAEVCGFPYDKVKDWGAYGDPIWQDPRDNAVVLWTDECPGLSG